MNKLSNWQRWPRWTLWSYIKQNKLMIQSNNWD